MQANFNINGIANKWGLNRKSEPESKQDLLNRFPSDLSHDGALSSQILITQTQEVVNDEGCRVWRKKGLLVFKGDH